MTKFADRGKWAEAEVEKVLTHLNEKYMGFAYDRQPDARSARGAIKAALCDFLWWWKDATTGKVSGLLEVKETKHNYRLTKDKIDQLPRMRKVRYAGGEGLVLVFHSEIKKWRVVPLEFFDGPIQPSWDLSNLPVYDTPGEALNSLPRSFPHNDMPTKENNNGIRTSSVRRR